MPIDTKRLINTFIFLLGKSSLTLENIKCFQESFVWVWWKGLQESCHKDCVSFIGLDRTCFPVPVHRFIFIFSLILPSLLFFSLCIIMIIVEMPVERWCLTFGLLFGIKHVESWPFLSMNPHFPQTQTHRRSARRSLFFSLSAFVNTFNTRLRLSRCSGL